MSPKIRVFRLFQYYVASNVSLKESMIVHQPLCNHGLIFIAFIGLVEDLVVLVCLHDQSLPHNHLRFCFDSFIIHAHLLVVRYLQDYFLKIPKNQRWLKLRVCYYKVNHANNHSDNIPQLRRPWIAYVKICCFTKPST